MSRPPFLVVVGLGADLAGAAVDLAGGGADPPRRDLPRSGRRVAELLLPRRGVREGDEIARPLVQFRQVRAGPGVVDVVADLPKDPLQAGLTVDLAVDVWVVGHG